MATPAKSARINQALSVIRHAQEGMSIVKACIEVGIARSTFYYICKTNPERIEEFQKLIEESERSQLVTMMSKAEAIVERLGKDALDEKTKARVVLAIKKDFDKRTDYLSEKLLRPHEDSERAREFLTGPMLEPGTSRFASYENALGTFPTSGSF